MKITEKFESRSAPKAEDQRLVATAKLAQELVAVLGYEGALLACQKNGWAGVRKVVTRNLSHFATRQGGRSFLS